MCNKFKFVFLSFVLFFMLIFTIHADRRSYVWTYEYMSMPKDMSEIEYYVTSEVKDTSKKENSIWKHWVELEYGITNKLDVAIYQQFTQSNKASNSSFNYEGFKVRTRYRIGEKGKFIINPLLYLEYIRKSNLSEPDILEWKEIISKDMGKLNVSYNFIMEIELGKDKVDHGYALGINYAIDPRLKIAIESKGSYTDSKYYVGSTISGRLKNFWIGFGFLFGLNNKSDDIQTRMISGIPF